MCDFPFYHPTASVMADVATGTGIIAAKSYGLAFIFNLGWGAKSMALAVSASGQSAALISAGIAGGIVVGSAVGAFALSYYLVKRYSKEKEE